MKCAIAGVVACAGVLGGCTVEVHHGSAGTTVEDSVTLEVAAGGARALVVESRAGGIDLDPAATPGVVRVTASRRAPTREDLDRIRVNAVLEDGEIRVGYAVTGSPERISVSFAVEAPSSLPASLRTEAGTIRAAGFDRGIEARTGAGSIRTDAVRGDLVLRSRAGSIRVGGAEGRVTAETGAGSVEVEGRLRGDCSLVSRAGSLTATLPADSRLKVEGRTAAGGVRCDLPLTVSGRYAAKGLRGTLGDGSEGTLTLETSAGSLTVRSGR